MVPSGSDKGCTLKFQGVLLNHSVLILLDSGSSHTFVSNHLRDKLQPTHVVPISVSVRVANGEVLLCEEKWLQVPWQIQGCTFLSDILFLPLRGCDMVVGMDWLQTFSPMRVDWVQQWLAIPYQGQEVILYGHTHPIPECTVVELLLVSDEVRADAGSLAGWPLDLGGGKLGAGAAERTPELELQRSRARAGAEHRTSGAVEPNAGHREPAGGLAFLLAAGSGVGPWAMFLQAWRAWAAGGGACE
jgi:hypothetical protein